MYWVVFCITCGAVVTLVMKGQIVPVARRVDGRVCHPNPPVARREWAYFVPRIFTPAVKKKIITRQFRVTSKLQ